MSKDSEDPENVLDYVLLIGFIAGYSLAKAESLLKEIKPDFTYEQLSQVCDFIKPLFEKSFKK
jgi:hypothetical protein